MKVSRTFCVSFLRAALEAWRALARATCAFPRDLTRCCGGEVATRLSLVFSESSDRKHGLV